MMQKIFVYILFFFSVVVSYGQTETNFTTQSIDSVFLDQDSILVIKYENGSIDRDNISGTSGGGGNGYWNKTGDFIYTASDTVTIGRVGHTSRALLHIGDSDGTNSIDPVVSINRNLTGPGNSHGFSDSSVFGKDPGTAYNSYDARVTYSGTNNFDHNASFQSAPIFNTTGTVDDHFGFYDLPIIGDATLTNRKALAVIPPTFTGSGSLTYNYGLYMPSQGSLGTTYGVYVGPQSSTNNYGIWIDEPTAGTIREGIRLGNFSGYHAFLSDGGLMEISSPALTGTDLTNLVLSRAGAGVNDQQLIRFTASTVYEGAIGVQLMSGTDADMIFKTNTSGGSNLVENMRLKHDGQLQVNQYGSGTFSATGDYIMGVENGTGNLVEIDSTALANFVGVGTGGSSIYTGDGTAPSDVDVTVTDNIDFDANTLFIDGTNNRVGIGTASPLYDFSILGKMEITDANGSVIIGVGAGAVNANDNNVFVGENAGAAVTTAHSNTLIGSQAGKANIGGTYVTAVGYNAAAVNTVATTTAIGGQALESNTTGTNNFAGGFRALQSNTIGSSCVAIGNTALRFNTTGSSCVALGNNALGSNVDGINNLAIGTSALDANVSHDNNVAIGKGAMSASTSSDNTCIGTDALPVLTTGAGNVYIGKAAGFATTTSTQCTVIGTITHGDPTNLTNVVAIGYDIEPVGDNTIWLGNSNNTELIVNEYNLNIDQTLGASEDNYLLTYDNTSGQASFEALGAGIGGIYGGSGSLSGTTSVTMTTDSLNLVASSGALTYFGSAGGVITNAEFSNKGLVASNVSTSGTQQNKIEMDGVSKTQLEASHSTNGTKALIEYQPDTVFIMYDDGTDTTSLLLDDNVSEFKRVAGSDITQLDFNHTFNIGTFHATDGTEDSRVVVAPTNAFIKYDDGSNFSSEVKANGSGVINTVDDGTNSTTVTQSSTLLTIDDVLRLVPRSSAPSSPTKGMIYMDDTTNKLRCYDGTTWNDLF